MSAPGPELDTRSADAIAIEAGSSFSRPIKLLSPDRRRAATAVYAFCRVVDDIADEPGEENDKRAGLAAWRAEVERCVLDQAHSNLGQEIAWSMRQFDLSAAPFLDTLIGVEMDVGAPISAPTMAELQNYARHVATPAGALFLAITGVTHPKAQELSLRLGEAVQFTNILRDLREDADIGRLYLPSEYLQQAGVPAAEPLAVIDHPDTATVCQRLGQDARQAYIDADALMADMKLGRQLTPVRLIAASYRGILEIADTRGWPGLKGERVRLGGLRGVTIFARVLLRGLFA